MTESNAASPTAAETTDILRFLHRFADLMSNGSNSDNLLDVMDLTSDIGPMRAMAGVRYPTPLVDPSRTNDELGITLTPVRAGVAKTVAWLHAQHRI